MKRPSPEVILSNFIKSKDGGYDAIEIDCHFWCEDQRDALRIRSGVLEDVHGQLKELDMQGESERGSDIK